MRLLCPIDRYRLRVAEDEVTVQADHLPFCAPRPERFTAMAG